MADTKTPTAKETRAAHTELTNLAERARTGDETAVPLIREFLQRPGAVGAFGGDLAEQVFVSMTKSIAGKNLAFREDVRCKLERFRAELSGDNPTPVERVLVERVVACWLQCKTPNCARPKRPTRASSKPTFTSAAWTPPTAGSSPR